MSSQEQWNQQHAFLEWWYQQHVYQVMFTNPPRESWIYARDSLGPSFYELYQQHVPTEDECIDPRLLQLSSQQPGGEGRPSGDHVADYAQGAGTLTSVENHVSHNLPQLLEPIMEIDEEPLGIGEEPVVEETNEQFFSRPEIQELVGIPDLPDIPEETSSPAETEVEEPEIMVSTLLPPVSPALSSPLSPPPPSPSPPLSPVLSSPVPLYTENSGIEVYRVERIVQAWGPHGGRQYLIRWEGWGEEFDSWEPAVNVSPDLILGFERSRLRRRLSFNRQRRQTRRWG